MQRIRVERHDRNFVTLDCTIFRDKRISLKAKGLHALIFQLPPNWDFTVEGIKTLSKDGRDGTNNAIKELIKFGYMERERKTDDKGRFKGYDYVIYEKPQSENVLSDNGKTENGKPVIGETENGKNDTIKVLNNKSINELNNIGHFPENTPNDSLFPNQQKKEGQQDNPSPLPPPQDEKPKKRKKAKSTTIDQSFLVELDAVEQCKKEMGHLFPNCDFQYYLDTISDWIASTNPNKKYVDWVAMVRGWIRRDKQYKTLNINNHEQNNYNRPKQQSTFDALNEALQRQFDEIDAMDEPLF